MIVNRRLFLLLIAYFYCWCTCGVYSFTQNNNSPKLLLGDEVFGNSYLLRKSQDEFSKFPPLVVCVGMAQSVETWRFHLDALSRSRDVLLHQAAGLGMDFLFQNDTDVSLPSQADRLCAAISTAFAPAITSSTTPIVVDLAGFSLGGRIAMAAACRRAQPRNLIINKLHLTGVSLQRSDYGHVQLRAWKDHLQHDDMRAFAWSAITASYSAAFLRSRMESKLPAWIQGVTDSHSAAGLLALMEQAHDNDDDDEYSVHSMAERIDDDDVKGRLLVGEYDLMAPVEHVQALAEKLDWPMRTVPETGHAVPMENPRAWRDDLLDFLNNDD